MKRPVAVLAGAAFALGLCAFFLLKEDPGKRPTPRGGTTTNGEGRPPSSVKLDPGSPPDSTLPAPTTKATPGPRPVPRRDAISGFVRDARGAAVPGARVRPVDDESPAATTRQDGAFTLDLASRPKDGKRLALLATAAPPLEARVVSGISPGTAGLVIVLRSGEGVLAARVVLAKDRSPVAGASVEATLGDWLARATADAEGRFRLEGAPSGLLALVVSKDGLVPRVLSLLSGKDGKEREIALESGVRVEGRVLQKSKPVAGAIVAMRVGGVPLSFERRTATSDERGAFSFDAIPPGESTLRARTRDGVSKTAVVRTSAGRSPDPVALELEAGTSVAGRVSSGGAPVAGASLSLKDRDDGSELAAVSGPDGRFRLEPIAEMARLELAVRASGFAPRRLPVKPGANDEVALQRAAALELTVRPGGGVEADALGSDGERRSLSAKTDTGESAELSLEDLPPGPAQILVRAPGRASQLSQLDLQEGRNSLDVVLTDGLTIEGRCVDEDGAPLGGVSVVAIPRGPLAASSETASEADGRFVLRDLARGKRRILAQAAGFLEAQLDADAGASGVSIELARSYGLEVRLSAGEAPLPRAFVRLSPLEGNGDPQDRVVAALPGSPASAVFDRLRGARYRIEALAPGLAPARAEIDPRRAASADLVLGKGARSSGVVVGPDGKPVPGVAIVIGRRANADIYDEGTFATLLNRELTSEDGKFSVVISEEGEDVVVTSPTLAPLLARLVPGEGQRLELAAGARLAGRTLAKDGSPSGGIGVLLEGPLSRRGASKPDGSFVFQGLSPGRYRVRRHDEAPDSPGVVVEVSPDRGAQVELRAP